MLTRFVVYIGSLGTAFMLLSGCDSLRSTFGLDHYQADAFSVPTNPPLTLPPDYNLRPPAPGAQPTYAVNSADMAQRTLGLPSAHDHTTHHILSTQHTTQTPPQNIRETLNREADDEDSITGKMQTHYKNWKDEAKKNLGSISSKN